jgi:guanyl-specific ribonuclease Sa
MRRVRVLMLILFALLAAIALWKQADADGPLGGLQPEPAVVTPGVVIPVPQAARPAPTASDPSLPPEAAATLAAIAAGGPFPYERDGVEFRNFEHRLPARPRGWYHEYTVPTPGVDHRGARRIVTGGSPPGEWWYTDDHYASFRRIEGTR